MIPMDSILILGRQPELGLAELESLYGARKVSALGSRAAIVTVDPCLLAFDRLGGSVKFCRLRTVLDTVHWRQIERFLIEVSPGHSTRMPEGKMTLGLSAIGFDVSPKQLEATGLSIKKSIKKTGRNVRLVPNKESELNTAQVIHNKLTSPTGWEIYLIRDGNKTVVAQTIKVQDIESYTHRDRDRPKRDTKVGMLPPKLAQIIINLATGPLPEDKLESICAIPAGQPVPRQHFDATVLDPFCGTGVVLQEAMLMGYDVYGSDLDQRMVDYSRANLDWLTAGQDFDTVSRLEQGDATDHKWPLANTNVASEVYLGRPFTSQPTAEILNQTISECNLIIKKFLRNIHGQIQPGTRLCLAVPAWRAQDNKDSRLKINDALPKSSKARQSSFVNPHSLIVNQFRRLPLLDSLEEIGYNQLEFERVSGDHLIYYREDQIVARQLLVLTSK